MGLVWGILAALPLAVGLPMSPAEVAEHRDLAKDMFQFAFDAYMDLAFPHDELRPISGTWTDSLVELGGVPAPERDGYAGVALTLIDGLDTIAVMGNRTAFADAVWKVADRVSFDQDAVVSVFETTIRALGGLLSGHLVAAGSLPGFEHMQVDGYRGELLFLARDLGDRLLPAFEGAPPESGVPYPFVHLRDGVGAQPVPEQCAAGVGTNLLEFAMLTNLTADPRYARASVSALRALWRLRSEHDLVGNTIDVRTGRWVNSLATIGAGVDSFYEYLAKGALFTGSGELAAMWDAAYAAVRRHLYLDGALVVGADMHSPGRRTTNVLGSLQAFWPAVQVLAGDVDDARAMHAAFVAVWDAVGAMPENFQIRNGNEVLAGPVPYPLRPEMAEATLALYRATGDHEHLRFGARMLRAIEARSRAPHGFASVRSVATFALEDHTPSYFYAETLKYLYLLFDEGNPAHAQELVLTTEAHLFPVLGPEGLPAEVWLEGSGAAVPDNKTCAEHSPPMAAV